MSLKRIDVLERCVQLHMYFWRRDMSVYKVIEIIGTSEKSWEEAAKNAVERASDTLEDLRIAEVTAQDMKIDNGKVVEYRTKVSLSFKFKED